MIEFDYNNIDDIVHSKVRLGIMTILISTKEAEYSFLLNKLGLTDGNLASHIKKLEEAKYIQAKKTFLKRKPKTIYTITKLGREAFEKYVNVLETLIKDLLYNHIRKNNIK